MSVSALNWKYIGSTSLGGATDIDDVLDGIYNLLNATSYYDGTSRTPGSGVAWNPTKYVDTVTKAVHCEPSSAASSTCQGMRIVFAGEDTGSNANFPLYDLRSGNGPADKDSGISASPTTRHTWEQAHLYGGLAKNAGNFTSITPGSTTTPFTSGGFTGFAQICDGEFYNNGTLFMYESLDAIYFAITDGSSADDRQNHFMAGGLLDPGSTASTDSEADEVVYALFAPGDQHMQAAFVGSVQKWPQHNAGNDNFTAISFSPGATTYTIQPIQSGLSYSIATIGTGDNVIKLRSNRRVLIPIYFNEFYTVGSVRHVVGRLREIFKAGETKTGNKLEGGGTDLGYFVAPEENLENYMGLLLKA
jgi:hypothetical protein